MSMIGAICAWPARDVLSVSDIVTGDDAIQAN